MPTEAPSERGRCQPEHRPDLAGDNQTNGTDQSYGGAIYNQGSATLRSSTFIANQALGSQTSFGGPRRESGRRE